MVLHRPDVLVVVPEQVSVQLVLVRGVMPSERVVDLVLTVSHCLR